MDGEEVVLDWGVAGRGRGGSPFTFSASLASSKAAVTEAVWQAAQRRHRPGCQAQVPIGCHLLDIYLLASPCRSASYTHLAPGAAWPPSLLSGTYRHVTQLTTGMGVRLTKGTGWLQSL